MSILFVNVKVYIAYIIYTELCIEIKNISLLGNFGEKHIKSICDICVMSLGSEAPATQPATPSSAYQSRQLAPAFASSARDITFSSVPIVSTASYVVAGNVLPSKL